MEDLDDIPCILCGKYDGEDWMLICEGCNKGYHTYCIEQGNRELPPAPWYCPTCVGKRTSASPATASTPKLVAKRSPLLPRKSESDPILLVESGNEDDTGAGVLPPPPSEVRLRFFGVFLL